MSNYDELKAKAKHAFSSIAGVSAEAGRFSKDKARTLHRKAKLTAGITNERATIRRLNVEIGATYYNMKKDKPDECLRQQCEDITAAYNRIAEKQAELETLKAGTSGDESPADTTACIDPNCTDPSCIEHKTPCCTDPDCKDPNCTGGTADAINDAAGDAADAVKDAASAATDTAKDLADDAKDKDFVK